MYLISVLTYAIYSCKHNNSTSFLSFTRTDSFQPVDCGIQFMVGDSRHNQTWGCVTEDISATSFVSQAQTNVTFTKFHDDVREWTACLGVVPGEFTQSN